MFSPVPEFKIKQEGDLDEYFEFVHGLPESESPELFGLNENADINYAISESNRIIGDMLSLSSKTGSGSLDEAQGALKVVKDIEEDLQEPFKISAIQKQYPMTLDKCMNTVLIQELVRYNALIVIMKSTIKNFEMALQGLEMMTPEMESMQASILNNNVPEAWKSKSYPSLKPLLSWFEDLQRRLDMFNTWIRDG
jgi:dynein heavy chain